MIFLMQIHIRKKHTPKESSSEQTRKKINKRKNQDQNSDKNQAVVENAITAHIECSQVWPFYVHIHRTYLIIIIVITITTVF